MKFNDVLIENLNASNVKKFESVFEWVKEKEINNFDDFSLEIENGIKHILLDEQYYIEESKVYKFCKTIRQPISAQGVQESSKFFIDFNPNYNEILIHSINIRRSNSKLDRLKTADMQILRRESQVENDILSGNMTLSIILDDIKKDDVVEISYTIITHNEVDVVFFNRLIQLEYNVPLYEINISVISEQEIFYKFFNKEYEIYKEKSDDKYIYTLNRRSVPAKKLSDYMPYWYYPVDLIQIGLKKSWMEISTYIGKKFRISDIEDKRIDELFLVIEPELLPDEKIVLYILNFINKNIRYFSTFDPADPIIPTDPNLVLERCYGDCKDYTNLFINLLAKFGIESKPVLVNTQYGRTINQHFPSASIFNHVIAVVKVSGEYYFIDPVVKQEVSSIKNLYLPEYGYGLICDEYSSSVRRIENQFKCENLVSVVDEYNCHSWKDNNFTYNSHVTISGLPALRIKQIFENQSENKFWENMRSFYNNFLDIKEVIYTKINAEALDNKVSFSFSYNVSLRSMFKEKRKYSFEVIPVDILEQVNYKLPQAIDSDFYFGSPIEIDYKISILDEWTNFTGFDEQTVFNDVFEFSKISCGDKGVFSFEYRFKKLNNIVLNKDFNKFMSKHADLIKILPGRIFKLEEIFIVPSNLDKLFVLLIFILGCWKLFFD